MTVLITKVLILIFGAQAYQVVTDQSLNQTNSFFGIWKRWDAAHYLDIAQIGYTATGEHRFMIVFFPLYSAITAVFDTVFDDYLISAFWVSGFASIALGLVFRELVRLDFSEKIAQYSVFFLFIFPTSFVLHIPYTESLFLALSIGCFLAARKKSWILAGVLGGLACLTRVNGLILFPALAFEVWEDHSEIRKFNRKWLYLFLIPAGFGIYLFINYYITGNPTMFLDYQHEHWNKYLRFPFYGIIETWELIFNQKPSAAIMTGFEELFFVLIGLFATVFGWRRLRNSYRVWMAANWLLFVSTSFVLSVPRYTLVLFPLFILMAQGAAKNWRLQVLYIVWSILYLSLFVTQFVRGWWAF